MEAPKPLWDLVDEIAQGKHPEPAKALAEALKAHARFALDPSGEAIDDFFVIDSILGVPPKEMK